MGAGTDVARLQDDSLESLRDAEAFNFALFQYNPLPTTVVDADGCVVKSNLARRNIGKALPELGTPLFADEAFNGTSLRESLQDCISNGHVHHFSDVAIGKRFMAVTIAPIPNGAIVICDDITDRKQAQQQLIQAQKMATMGTLVTGVAHEISNPNNALLLAGWGLKRNVDPLLRTFEAAAPDALPRIGGRPYDDVRSEIVEQVDVIERAGNRIRDFVIQLRDFARPKPVDLTAEVDMNTAVQNAISLLSPIIRSTTTRFRVDCDENLPPVAGDRQQLEQVIVNLVSNACQALTEREQSLQVSTASTAEHVNVTVRDEGVGMEPENAERIKEPFFTTKQDTGGTGLGLSISDKIIASHRGTLTFESEPGVGTVVTIQLPIAGRTDKTAETTA